MKTIFLKDIAKHLGLSKTTVSLVLNNKGDEAKISTITQKKIFEYAKRNNYSPNHLARGLSRGKTETLGLIVPNIADSHYAVIAQQIEERTKEMGYTVVFSSSNENPKDEGKLIRTMLNRQVDGLIIASTQQNHNEIELLKKNNFPFVLIDRHYPEIDTYSIISDNFGGVKKATRHLIELGRHKIGFLTLDSKLEVLKLRKKGYLDTLKKNNMEFSMVKELDQIRYNQEMEGAIHDLINGTNKVDALIFSTHYLTALGLRELKKNKINIPKDIAVVSFDEMSAFDLLDPPITSIIQPVKQMAKQAAEVLINSIENKLIMEQKVNVLETEMIIRKSCGSN